MNIQNKITNAIIYGMLGTVAVLISVLLVIPPWILFLGWISYYLFGKNPERAVNTYVLMLIGVILSMLMKITGELLTPIMGQYAILIVVFVLIGALTFAEYLKWFSNMAAYFLGMVIYFGSKKEYGLTVIYEISIPLILGFIFAWLAVLLRKKTELLFSGTPDQKV
ncbi:DUF1097 domain-containing protein [Pedobacter sp. PAMC26386]|nr:DUF1097 domain-containing protein [Pedobacter sp. PAMC26386]